MAEPKKTLKIVAVSPFRSGGKRIEVGETLDLPEHLAADVMSTNRARAATPENLQFAKDAAKKLADAGKAKEAKAKADDKADRK